MSFDEAKNSEGAKLSTYFLHVTKFYNLLLLQPRAMLFSPNTIIHHSLRYNKE